MCAMTTTKFEAVIGLETHVQLNTKSKMFSWSGAGYQKAEPNSLVDPVSMALPGTLPVVNRSAVESAIAIGLALNCDIAEVTKFDRKQYTYPDLMKGYQISQYDEPICIDGWIDLPTEEPCRVGINRVHMEEDVARLIHIDSPTGGVMHSLLDINRSGVPLMEIVTEPDMRTPEQVETYITELQAIIRYLGVGTANMEEGSFRCDANISVRPVGSEELGEKVEVKNMNRVRAVCEAVEYEIKRQVAAIGRGERIEQETRGWMDGDKVTVTSGPKKTHTTTATSPNRTFHLSTSVVIGYPKFNPACRNCHQRRKTASRQIGVSPITTHLSWSSKGRLPNILSR